MKKAREIEMSLWTGQKLTETLYYQIHMTTPLTTLHIVSTHKP